VGGSGQRQVRGARQREVSRAMVVKSMVHVLYRLHLKKYFKYTFFIFLHFHCVVIDVVRAVIIKVHAT